MIKIVISSYWEWTLQIEIIYQSEKYVKGILVIERDMLLDRSG